MGRPLFLMAYPVIVFMFVVQAASEGTPMEFPFGAYYTIIIKRGS
ncbi:hypothetical protein RB2501_14149 [Robiginitalea biformata HTCC2501]|uniref:Uncharacterized protein n=1 Tax=Robiginitalea biformata (strain ATCC BAA-864 / DSM 15991 / KCTC 12146 / HTCC2501) TaxID=313596 RepID=A4CKS7_ROBBH|nr:hypothetical protein RB2501_14149 [Robiginitalea biformata HTCC2501]